MALIWTEAVNRACHEAVDLPAGWVGMIFTAVGHPAVMVRGAVCPTKMRGPERGEPNWTKRDRATEREVFVSRAAYRAAADAEEAKLRFSAREA